MKAIIVDPSFEAVCGVPLVERTLRNLTSLGIETIYLVGKINHESLPEKNSLSIKCTKLEEISHTLEFEEKQSYLFLPGDYLIDPRIIEHLIDRSGQLADEASIIMVDEEKEGGVSPVGQVESNENWAWTKMGVLDQTTIPLLEENLNNENIDYEGFLSHLIDQFPVRVVKVSEIDGYLPKLRRDIKPYWLPVNTKANKKKAAYTLIQAGQKDPSDLIARYIHNPIENWVVAQLANYPVTPNQVTILVNLLAYLVVYLFITGHLLAGSAITFLVGLMDGFDGKLARVKGMTTKIGSLEHSFDLLFEASWIIGLAYYLSLSLGIKPLILALSIVVLTAFYRDIYNRFGQATGKSLDVYGKLENHFRRIAGRRNLYNVHILIFVMLGQPIYALFSIACHAFITAVIYTYRALRHLHKIDRRSR